VLTVFMAIPSLWDTSVLERPARAILKIAMRFSAPMALPLGKGFLSKNQPDRLLWRFCYMDLAWPYANEVQLRLG
jgi:hypothetical protein